MIRNYIKIAWRNLGKNRAYSTINIFGLALGMMVSTLIALWIQNEATYDRFYSTTDNLYQVFTADEFDGEKHAWGATPAILGPVLKQEHPEIDEVVRTYRIGGLMNIGDKITKWWEHLIGLEKTQTISQGMQLGRLMMTLRQ